MTTMTATKNKKSPEDRLHSTFTRVFADVMRAFMECSDDVQRAIIEMVEIVNDPESDLDDSEMALATIQEALFPTTHNGNLGADISELEDCGRDLGEIASVIAELDAEEAAFADRVQKLMDARSMTQTELAEASGVGQPAISMMLSRESRPQKRTVLRIAEALKVNPEELWPSK